MPSPRAQRETLCGLRDAVKLVTSCPIRHLVPEVGMQIVVAAPEARTLEEIAGIDGRIVRITDGVKAVGPARFGVSLHMARSLLAIRRYDPTITAAMNIRYSPAILARLHALKLHGAFFSRAAEPPEQAAEEGKTLSWAVDQVMKTSVRIPDWIADRGWPGKEAMIRLFAPSLPFLLKTALAL